MKLLNQYFDIQKQIYEYFGYEEEWSNFALDDNADYYWFIVNGQCVWSNNPFTEEDIISGKTIYSGYMYGSHKQFYRKDDYTMVKVDTSCDGNRYLMIFDNEKECKDQTLIERYKDIW